MDRQNSIGNACGSVSSNQYEKCEKTFDDCMDRGVRSEELCACEARGGVILNTNIPFIGRCIELANRTGNGAESTAVTQATAFPILMRALMNIVLSIILVASLIMVIAGGVMIASGGASDSNFTTGKSLIRKVIIGLILLGSSGIILSIINPNFFG